MQKIKKNIIQSLLLTPLLALTTSAIAEEGEALERPLSALQQEILWLKEETYVTTATKTLEAIKKSGATVSVITSTDLKNMGARNLMDALKRVPGLGIDIINIGIPSIEVRGVKADFSEKVLFLINGHPTNNNLVNGGATWSYNNFIVDDIKRVEVVRGPGSALYGANAFVAVINIITKTSNDINGTELTIAAGSNDAKKINIQVGDKTNEVAYAANLNFFDTDGFRETVQADALGTSGDTNDWNQRYDFGFNLNFLNYSLQGKYLKRNSGPYIGTANALNDESEQEYVEYFVELGYTRELSQAFHFNSKLYYDRFESDNYWEVYPEGFAGFQDGMLGRSPITNERMGAELQFDYVYGQHKALLGIMYESQAQFNVGFEANFNPTTGAPLQGGYQDIMDRWPWNGSHDREINAIFLQDIWDMHEDLRLILGARYDRYSDFGDSFNPRASLNWEFIENYSLIATYGSAFRAPTFGEQHNINNPFVIGNPDVNPEKIKTFELGLSGDINKRTQFSVTGFHNRIKNLISPTPNPPGASVSNNIGELRVRGIETEFTSRLRNGSSFDINYTYQYAVNELTGQRVADVPMHKANASFNYRYSQYMSTYIGLLHRGQLKRSPGDVRSGVSDYITVDLAINWQNYIDNLAITASVYNLLDEEYVDAAPAGTVASDFPKPGRNLMVEASYKL